MKNKVIKILSLCLCTVLVVCAIDGAVFAIGGDDKKEDTSPSTEETTEEISEDTEVCKDETVYVIAKADGSVQKVIVSDWIKNALGSKTLDDKTALTDVVNVKGDESFTLGIDGGRVWDAEGNDIYYQGNIEKELPVALKVSYKLDGKSISPDELRGKSGKVTIRFDYENKQYETVKIGGKDEKIYVPFAMLTGLILDNDIFTNIEVSNGKLINDGSRTVIAGLAFPGLKEDLGIDDERFEIPDYVEITADAKDFSLGMTVTVATNEIFNELDPEQLDKIDGITSSLSELSDAMSQLVDGSSKLYDGLCTLLDKSGELVAGIDKLAAGAEALKNGAAELDGGVDSLRNGVDQLSCGLDTLASNNDALNGGAKQVFDTLLATAKAQLTAAGLTVPDMTAENYDTVLSAVIDSLDDEKVYATALGTVTQAVEAKRGYITEQVTSAVKAQVEEGVAEAVRAEVERNVTAAVRSGVEAQVTSAVCEQFGIDAQMLTDELKQVIAQNTDAQMATEQVAALVSQNTDAKMESDDVKSIISANVENKMASDDVKALIAKNVEAQIKKAVADAMAGDEVQAKLAAASDGAKQVISLKTSLDSYNAFYLGLQSYTAGVAKAAGGAAELKSGASQLKAGSAALSAGADELYRGILTLKGGVPALTDGITQLRDGSMTLSEGLKEFNKEGVQKLVDAVYGNLSVLLERVRATIEVSKNYRNFAGISDGMDGAVKFIYRTAEIDG